MIVTILFAAACSSAEDPGDDGGGVASLSTPTESVAASAGDEEPESGSTPGVAATEDFEATMAEYESCLEDEGIPPEMFDFGEGGVDVDDPQAEADAEAIIEALEDMDPALFEEATEACAPLLDNVAGVPDLTPEQQAVMEDSNAAFEECMTEQGIDLSFFDFADDGAELDEGQPQSEDPQAGGFGAEDFDEEAFNAAAEACGDTFAEVEAMLSEEGLLPGSED